MSARRANRVDTNAKAICEEFRKEGAWVFVMPPGAGFDLLVAWNGHLIAVEVKDGRKPPSARKLTERENDVRKAFDWRGITYHIVENIDDAHDVLGEYEEVT